ERDRRGTRAGVGWSQKEPVQAGFRGFSECLIAMYRLYASLALLLSLCAAGPAMAASGPDPLAQAGQQPVSAQTARSGSTLLPLWHADNGQSWALLTRNRAAAPATDAALALHGPGFAAQSSSGFEYVLNPRWATHA